MRPASFTRKPAQDAHREDSPPEIATVERTREDLGV